MSIFPTADPTPVEVEPPPKFAAEDGSFSMQDYLRHIFDLFDVSRPDPEGMGLRPG